MYIVALFIVFAILLEAVMTVLNSVLGIAKLGDMVKKVPIVGPNLTLIMSILMVWALGDRGLLLGGWGWGHEERWFTIVVTGAIVAGMVPLKDAVFGAIGKGMRA